MQLQASTKSIITTAVTGGSALAAGTLGLEASRIVWVNLNLFGDHILPKYYMDLVVTAYMTYKGIEFGENLSKRIIETLEEAPEPADLTGEHLHQE